MTLPVPPGQQLTGSVSRGANWLRKTLNTADFPSQFGKGASAGGKWPPRVGHARVAIM
jgi:hypothetical protein